MFDMKKIVNTNSDNVIRITVFNVLTIETLGVVEACVIIYNICLCIPVSS